MPSWSEFEVAAPELAERVRARLDAYTHKTLATLRLDGSPRISGTETVLRDGELWIGSMWHARKARDLQRDPRFALHSGSDDPPDWTGDAKLAGIVRPFGPIASVPARPARSLDGRARRPAQGARDRGLDARARRADDRALLAWASD